METFPEMADPPVSEGPIRLGLSKGNAAANVTLLASGTTFRYQCLITKRDVTPLVPIAVSPRALLNPSLVR